MWGTRVSSRGGGELWVHWGKIRGNRQKFIRRAKIDSLWNGRSFTFLVRLRGVLTFGTACASHTEAHSNCAIKIHKPPNTKLPYFSSLNVCIKVSHCALRGKWVAPGEERLSQECFIKTASVWTLGFTSTVPNYAGQKEEGKLTF